MGENELLFHEVFKDYGGLFNIHEQKINEAEKNSLLLVMRVANDLFTRLNAPYPTLPPINFNFVNNLTLNAYAQKSGEKYFIGLNIGTCYSLFDLFSKMFSTKTIYPAIGDVSIETDKQKIITSFIEDGFVVFDPLDSDFCYPKDEKRQKMVTVCQQFVIMFLIYHEIGHIIRGHCGYLIDFFGAINWIEYGKNDKKGSISSLDFQTMEMSADSFALNNTYLTANEVIKYNLIHKNLDYPLSEIYNNLETFFELWFFSIYSFFRLTQFCEFDPDEDEKYDHPPATIRVELMLGNVYAIMIRDYSQEAAGSMFENIINGMIRAETAFLEVSNDDKSLDVFMRNSLSSIRYKEKIIENWDILYYLVKPFAINPDRLPLPLS